MEKQFYVFGHMVNVIEIDKRKFKFADDFKAYIKGVEITDTDNISKFLEHLLSMRVGPKMLSHSVNDKGEITCLSINNTRPNWLGRLFLRIEEISYYQLVKLL